MKKQFGIAMVALTAAMAFTFTACNDDSTSAKEPSKVSKAEDLSKDCEDGEEALVGDKDVLYTCKDGKWTTEEAAKSSASKPKSSSSKVEDSDEDEDEEENGDEEEEVKSSSSKKKPSSASSDEGGSGEGTSSTSVNQNVDPSFKGKMEMDVANCGNIWCGPNQDVKVKINNLHDQAGRWFFSYDSDTYPDGNSKIQWPTEVTKDNFHNYIKADYGIEGTAVLGGEFVTPFVYTGFYVFDPDGKSIDINDWNGLCVTYRSTEKILLVLGYYDYDAIGADPYFVEMPASKVLSTRSFLWKDFNQKGFGTSMDIGDYFKNITLISFYMYNTDNDFKIVSLGKAGSCKKPIPPEFAAIGNLISSWSEIDYEKDVYEAPLNKALKTTLVNIMDENSEAFSCDHTDPNSVKCTAGSHEALLSETKIRITPVTTVSE